MNRKGLVVMAVMTVLAASGAFAALPEFKLSAGAGGFFNSDFGGGATGVTGYDITIKSPFVGGGGFVFFDATYAEVALGFGMAHGKNKVNPLVAGFTENVMDWTGMDIGVLGKYPFALGEHLTLFPLLGLYYRFVLISKTDGQKSAGPAKNANYLSFRFGAGADWAFTEHLFMRLGLTYGIRTTTQSEKNMYKSPYNAKKTRLGHGLDIKLAAGWKF